MDGTNEYMGVSTDGWYTTVENEDLLKKLITDNNIPYGAKTETLQLITKSDISVLTNGRTEFFPAGTVQTVSSDMGWINSFVTATAGVEIILSATF